jgi:hypothetical protein
MTVSVPVTELREGDRIPLVTLTVGSVMIMGSSVYVQFKDNERVDVLDANHMIEVIRSD